MEKTLPKKTNKKIKPDMDELSLDRWNWEFLRRNHYYIQSYEDLKELFQKKQLNEEEKERLNKSQDFLVGTNIRLLSSKNQYGYHFPDPYYDYFPTELKPLFTKLTSPIETDIVEPVRVFTGNKLRKEIKSSIYAFDIRRQVDDDSEAIFHLVEQVLSPGVDIKKIKKRTPPLNIADDTIYLGISRNAKKNIVEEVVKKIIDKYIYPPDKTEARYQFDKYKTYLDIWDERRLKKHYKKIAKNLSITEQDAINGYIRCFELIYKKKYEPENFKRQKVKKEFLKRTCETCEEKKDYTCPYLPSGCPDISPYVDGEEGKQQIIFSLNDDDSTTAYKPAKSKYRKIKY